jgi:hypothetical protein
MTKTDSKTLFEKAKDNGQWPKYYSERQFVWLAKLITLSLTTPLVCSYEPLPAA